MVGWFKNFKSKTRDIMLVYKVDLSVERSYSWQRFTDADVDEFCHVGLTAQ